MPFKIALMSDVRSFLTGTRDARDALEDVADALDDVADDAQRAARDAGGELERIGEDGAESADKLERKFRDAFEDVSRHADRETDKVARDTKRNMDRADDSVGEFKDEARSNFSEVASSFTGDMDSAVDGVQGLFGGLAGSLGGPAGLAAGVLAGVGGALYASMAENAEKTEERIGTMFDDLAQSGLDYASQQYVVDELTKIYQRADDAAISWGNLQRVAETTGLSQQTVARAFAGDATAADALTAKLGESWDALGTSVAGMTEEQRRSNYELYQGAGELDEVTKLWETQTGVVESARGRVDEWRTAVEQTKTAAGDARGEWVDLDTYIDQTTGRDRSMTVTVNADLSVADRTIRNWRPVITGVVRAGNAVV